jgi:lipoyl(octanoyl) transferase
MAPDEAWPVPEWLGRVAYLDALAMQRERRSAILSGDAPEAVWLLEHDPVITTGRRDPGLVASQLDLPVVCTERGGLATWHGPGQLVGYLLLDVHRRGGGVKATVLGVQQGIVDWLAGRGVASGCRPGFPGVWVDGAKICAVGMHFRRGVSMHGFALNLRVDPSSYSGFDPCGIRDAGVTSLDRVGGGSVDPEAAASGVGDRVVRALQRSFVGRGGRGAGD